MKLVMFALTVLVLSTAARAQQPAAPPQIPPAGAQAAAAPAPVDRAKISYALGLDLGTQLRRQGIDLDPAIFAKAFADAMTGAKLEMTPEEARATSTQRPPQLWAGQPTRTLCMYAPVYTQVPTGEACGIELPERSLRTARPCSTRPDRSPAR